MMELGPESLRQVRLVAWGLARRGFPRDREEMISDGYVGLVRAARDYRPDRGAKFATFAEQRIRGAMLDGCRSWYHSRRRGQAPKLASLEGEPAELVRRIPAPGPDPGESLEAEDLRARVAGALERLRRRERLVVMLYYWDGRSMAAIARILGVNESRVSQLHRSATCKLRHVLRAAWQQETAGAGGS